MAQKLYDFVAKETNARFGQIPTLNLLQIDIDLEKNNDELIKNISHP